MEHKGLVSALFALQSSVKPLNKSKQGHGYKYAPLPEVLEYLQPLLQANRLLVQQVPEYTEGVLSIKTTVTHIDSGESLSVSLIAPAGSGRWNNAMQQLGNDITYLRRYSLSTVLGLSSEEDVDGSFPEQQFVPQKPAAKQKQAEQPNPDEVSAFIVSAQAAIEHNPAKETFTSLKLAASKKFGTVPKQVSEFLKQSFDKQQEQK